MYSFIARQPIVDGDNHIVAYELLFREGFNNVFPQMDPNRATSRLLIEHFFLTNVQGYDGKLCLVNFPYQSLVNQVPTLFPPHLLMIEILESCPPNDELFEAVKSMHQKGYKIALDDFIPSSSWERFLPYITTVKFDIKQISITEAEKFIKQHKQYNLYYLAEKIENKVELEASKQAGFDYFQGYIIYEPEIIKKKRIGSSPFTVEQLNIAINSTSIDFELVERLIRHDVTMSYKLMRFINSHQPQPFSSFTKAFATLGYERIKMFISLSIAAAHELSPSRYYQSSMERAHFCEQVAATEHINTSIDQAYFVGMFSELDKLLEQPLSQLIHTLPLTPEAINALLEQKGILGDILALAIAYEKNDQSCIKWFSKKLKLAPEDANLYRENALNWSTPEYHYLRLEGKKKSD
ncbi:EAL and HDOD domain-containing protein [Vibrio casei]|uniref:EAL domain-containing protein n=1 Tax=Vibrio casei TaxID=673372 RepID=A0A368LNC6_9VIBR|nr:EAL domain-containing protein [Vibrio casei]RCS73023.1 EAL domain-containing protein [Vibrio casei]SJN33075.1 Predicted signal transduction protein [Vibrio casei]